MSNNDPKDPFYADNESEYIVDDKSTEEYDPSFNSQAFVESASSEAADLQAEAAANFAEATPPTVPDPEDIYPGTTDNSAVTPGTDAGADNLNESSDPKKKLSPVDGKLSRETIAGLDNTKLQEMQPEYDIAECEKEIKGENNARIILGRDRPNNIASGYGAMGHTRSGAIDIVVGLQGWDPKEGGYYKNQKGESSLFGGVDYDGGNFAFAGSTPPALGPWIPPFADKNFGSMDKDLPGDAARIYISQRADVDDYFDICTGNVGRSIADSAIAMKADSVRIMSRKGIKLVTGKNPPGRTSLDGKMTETFGIDLIAGNRDINRGKLAKLLDDNDVDYLQPIPKGDNLVEALTEMVDRTSRLNYILQNVFLFLVPAITELQLPHVGFDAMGTPVTTFIPTGGVALSTLAASIQSATTQLGIQRIALDLLKVDFLTDKGAVYINSRYNRTN
jgi:hypothetical protein